VFTVPRPRGAHLATIRSADSIRLNSARAAHNFEFCMLSTKGCGLLAVVEGCRT